MNGLRRCNDILTVFYCGSYLPPGASSLYFSWRVSVVVGVIMCIEWDFMCVDYRDCYNDFMSLYYFAGRINSLSWMMGPASVSTFWLSQ